jgi:hypothetical protein
MTPILRLKYLYDTDGFESLLKPYEGMRDINNEAYQNFAGEVLLNAAGFSNLISTDYLSTLTLKLGDGFEQERENALEFVNETICK